MTVRIVLVGGQADGETLTVNDSTAHLLQQPHRQQLRRALARPDLYGNAKIRVVSWTRTAYADTDDCLAFVHVDERAGQARAVAPARSGVLFPDAAADELLKVHRIRVNREGDLDAMRDATVGDGRVVVEGHHVIVRRPEIRLTHPWPFRG